MKKVAVWLLACAFIVAVAAVIGFIVLFFLGRRATEQEWSDKTARERTPAEIRGLMQSMVETPQSVPNFVPQSMLDDDVCSAAVCNAVNFTVGRELLKCGAAWRFPKTNEQAISRTVFDRSKDFSIVTNSDGKRRIVEDYDRNFWLTSLLDPNKLYVAGYHYHDTLHDEEIVADGTGLNSHLAWLLPLKDGRRWCYHLVHRPNRWDENPYRVEPVDELPDEFDLIYIWELKGIVLPEAGDKMVLVNRSLPFSELRFWLNKGPAFAEYYLDTGLVWLRNQFGKYEQFPVVQKLDNGFIDFGVTGRLYHGTVLGAYEGEYLHAHLESTRGKYGLEYQCVEFVNRFYSRVLGHRNLTQTGHADSYLWEANEKGLVAYMNGSKTKPQVHDLLIFDGGDGDGDPGHLAVVISVSDSEICFVQQNFYRNNVPVIRDCLPLAKIKGNWFVDAADTDYLPVAGWSRIKESKN